MFSPKTILLPVDLAAESHAALKFAAGFARHSRARVIVLNVQDAELPPNLMSLPDHLITGHESEWLRVLKRQMTARCSDELLSGLVVEPVFSGGVPHDEILKTAKEKGCDMIIMEATARVRPRGESLGSTAEAVIAASTLPVLLVRSVQRHFVYQTGATAEIALNRILLATNFEKADQPAQTLAIDLARQFSARLVVLTVMEQVGLLRALLPGVAAQYEETFQSNAESAFGVIEQAAAGLHVERIVRDGSVYHEVVQFAAEGGIDLIVIGNSPRGTWLLGSNAERITRLAPCPVLIVRGG